MLSVKDRKHLFFSIEKELHVVVDWSLIDKEDYLLATERILVKTLELKTLLQQMLTDKIDEYERD